MTKIKKPIRFTICMFVLLSIILFGSLKLVDVFEKIFGSEELSLEKMATMDLEKNEDVWVESLKDEVVIYHENTLKGYTFKGDEKWKIEKTVESPILRSSENYIFVGEKNTGQILAFDSQGNNLWSFEGKKPIRDFLSNKNGFIAIYGDGVDGGEEVILLNSEGVEEGRIPISKGYIIDVALGGEDLVALSIMDIENNQMKTNVVLYSVKGKLLGGNRYKGYTISNLFFSKDNRLFNVGDNKLTVFSKEQGLLWTKEMPAFISRVGWNDEGFLLMNAINQKKIILDTKNQNYIGLVDINGKEWGKTPIKGEVLGIASKGNLGVIFTKRTLYFISEQGQLLGEKKINSDIQGVHMISDHQLILILKNKIETMEVKYKK